VFFSSFFEKMTWRIGWYGFVFFTLFFERKEKHSERCSFAAGGGHCGDRPVSTNSARLRPSEAHDGPAIEAGFFFWTDQAGLTRRVRTVSAHAIFAAHGQMAHPSVLNLRV
jgi:hypothetical protein